MLHLLTLVAAKLYFIMFVFLLSYVLRTPSKEMDSCVVGFRLAIVPILNCNVRVQRWGLGVNGLQRFWIV